ncbi:type VI secretion system protein TssA [Cronobacter sakazakii]|nr:type VI secretion system protein TssA [Cronobacter sakazakii]ELQ6018079.1 type VI secretion system protein TssA [Cronobacter sakazakii]ELY3795870.1 type VI secretion system protein TssA [Cronobacter sakazakii]ELY3829872.1 type VI secretion system protein TssA [Cronobacter sakazakii]ELY4144009.1 type VI secretion system protein TssA [Cronobacter sakazakii]
MDIETLLTPVSPEQPCGDNLEYDADYQAMEQASQGKAEQQFGDTIIPAEPADWTKVEKLALSLLERTKDLRVMLALTHAWTKRRGLPGYADGLLLIQEALTRYWEPLYPLLEEYGEKDPFYRINALAGLGDKSSLTSTLRTATLLRSNGDEITLRDAQSLLDNSKSECPGYPGGRPRLVDELARGGQPGIEAIVQIHARLETIRTILVSHLGESGVPEMEQLQKLTSIVALACQSGEAQAPQELQDPDVQAENAPAATTTSAPARVVETDWRNVQLQTRDDAQLMLEKVKQYFARHEPSHPAPLMIERVQRLIEMNFMDLIRDLAPDSVHQVENIFGRRE